MARRDRDEPEVFANYDEYVDGFIWPSKEPHGGIQHTHVDEMAPQHAASAIHKLRRWVYSEWSTDIDCERAWQRMQRSSLYRALAARATGIDDLSEALVDSPGLSDKQSVHLVARTLMEGAGDHEDPVEIVATAQKLVGRMYERGYVIIPRKT